MFRSKNCKYSEDKVWYRKDIKSDNYLEVPKRQLRYNLIQHDTTAAYILRTNGVTERFNQTLCESLRKHAEANPLDWVKWLPCVLMCNRRRVHSITGYSTFQLIFGRQMKHFGDWCVQEAEDEVLAHRSRAVEIQKLVHLFQPAALRAIEEHHPAQPIAQNSQYRIDDTIL